MSWSGESSELQGIVSYTRRFSIPLIAITAGERSALAREVRHRAVAAEGAGGLPARARAHHLDADATRASATRWRSRFWRHVASPPIDFKTFHPGGKLGASLTHVGDIMHSGENMPLVPLGTSMPDAVLLLSQKHYGCVGVVNDDGKLIGIVTDGDIARNLSRNLAELNVDDIMTRTPKTVRPTTLATAALGLLNQHNISALIVTDETAPPIGIVHFHDLLRIGVA